MNSPEYRLDEYTRELQIQNAGGTCEHCGSSLGHRLTCPLITNATRAEMNAKLDAKGDKHFHEAVASGFYRAKQHSALPDPLDETAGDEAFLRSIGIKGGTK